MISEDKIKVGLSSIAHYMVEEEHGAAHIGSGSIRVLSTPWAIAFLEITARKMLDEHLPDTHSSVGTHVDVRHLAPSPIGAEVEARVGIISRDRKKIHLSVDLLRGDETIVSGSHARFIIEKAKFIERL
jgi:fluoroacetyl-CoA thioesterase